MTTEKAKIPTVFVSEPSSHLSCLFCGSVYDDPVINIKCGHTFCQKCASKSPGRTCPSDNSSIDTSQLVSNRLAVGLIEDLQIYCRHGLLWKDGKWEKFADSCSTVLSLGSRDEHESACPFAPKSCPNSDQCGTVKSKDLEQHILECVMTPCQYKKFGCNYTGTPTQVDTHEKACVCKEGGHHSYASLPNTIQVQESSIKTIQKENCALKDGITKLEDDRDQMAAQLDKQNRSEEQTKDPGVKWTFLEHKGPLFAPSYEPVPKNVRFYYDGKPMELTEATEEVATFYGRTLDHDYTTRDVFNNNFFKDWIKVMTKEERAKITDLKKCNFVEYNDYFKKKSEERKAMSKEEKQRIKKENEEITLEYGFCFIDKYKEKIGNFRIEPPGLFHGRGDHPKQGMLKQRVMPEDVIINCSKDSNIPQPPAGHKWKELRHDNTVTWLASWTENIQGASKYVMLNAASSSRLMGQIYWQKYETVRKLHQCVDKIRANYQEDWKSKEMRVRQRAVALYFIDKLGLRTGNWKSDEESADKVSCCSLRVEHITLHEEQGGKQHVVQFDFLGTDSIRYQNAIPVEKKVFRNLQLFQEHKLPEEKLFDRLNTIILNEHLQDLMEGLTAKVFRTYNASRTLSEQLELLTDPNDQLAAKLLSYNRANRAVAILCNHQCAVPNLFEKSMENLQKRIVAKNDDIKVVKKTIKAIKAQYEQEKSLQTKMLYEEKEKTLGRLEEELTEMELEAADKDENKEIALSISNLLDPRISVAWCKKFDVPVEKVFNKTQRDKFRWAIDMATEHFKF